MSLICSIVFCTAGIGFSPHLSRLQGPRVDGYDGNGAVQAASALRLYRVDTSFSHVSTKRLTSAFVEFHPKLIRKAPSASTGSIPMASSTWDRFTLPEEHADPDDSATPSRSKRIRAVSAFRPAIAKESVFGRRPAAAPNTTASGAIRRSSASAKSRRV